MGEIDSPLGRRQFETGQPPKKFTVPDDSGSVEDYEMPYRPPPQQHPQQQQQRRRQVPNREFDINSPEGRLQAAKAQAMAQGQAYVNQQQRYQQPQQPPQQPPQQGYGQPGYDEQPQSEYIPAKEAMDVRRQYVTNNQRIDPQAKTRMEMLAGIGRAKRDVVVETEDGKVTFSIRTLKGWETTVLADLAQVLATSQSVRDIYALRTLTLTYAIFAIDNVDIEVVLGVRGADDETIIEAKKLFINELDESVLNYIHSEYQKLAQENLDRFGIKTEEDAKEVAEQMKKSSEGAGS